MRLSFSVISIISLFTLNCSYGLLLTSPCPDILKYLPDTENESNKWTAEISLSTEDELQGVWLHVVLDKKANSLMNWFGESSTVDNQEYSIRNAEYKLEAGPSVSVKIRALYNPAEAPPTIHRIRLNGRTICAADKPTRPTQTPIPFISLNRPDVEDDDGLIPPRVTERTTTTTQTRRPITTVSTMQTHRSRTTTDSAPQSEFFSGDFAQLVSSESRSEKRGHRPNGLNGEVKCGMPIKRATPLITRGKPSAEGAWPWHIAIYISSGFQLRYICGGSLLTKRHILTAAHCVVRPDTNKPADPDGFLIHLGRTNLKRFGAGTQERQVERITIHPNFNQTYFYNDIAILYLSRPVDYTDYVRPVCLWHQGRNDTIVDELGTVVGWGFDENKQITDTLQETKMPVVDLVKCIYSNRDVFNKFTSINNFCAGFMNGTSVCNGDSGGGMFFQRTGPNHEDEMHWELRGMVSVSQVLQNRYCDPYGYTVFTDVLKFSDWINENTQ